MVRLNGECPVKYGIRLNSESKYLDLKKQLYELCGIKSERLLLAEVAYCQIRSLLRDDDRVNPSTATELYAYELPDVDHVEMDEDTIEKGLFFFRLAFVPLLKILRRKNLSSFYKVSKSDLALFSENFYIRWLNIQCILSGSGSVKVNVN